VWKLKEHKWLERVIFKKNILVCIICFLTGVILGFLLAPIKQGIGNNSGNSSYYYKDAPKAEEKA
jgi:hypothetical protein